MLLEVCKTNEPKLREDNSQAILKQAE